MDESKEKEKHSLAKIIESTGSLNGSFIYTGHVMNTLVSYIDNHARRGNEKYEQMLPLGQYVSSAHKNDKL